MFSYVSARELLLLAVLVTICAWRPAEALAAEIQSEDKAQVSDRQDPKAPPPAAPRELSMVSLPAYRIEPPDILQIEMLKLVPLPPYRAEVYDVLNIRVVGTLLDQPINGHFLVETEGTITLGPSYGKLRVAGMTLEEMGKAINRHLRLVLSQPAVSVQLARAAGTAPVTGEYMVGLDGTINLRQYGAVRVAGKTLVEARLAIEKQLARFLDSPEVSVDVRQFNSKVFYVITEGAGLGDNVVRLPITGNETVLDAISSVGGLSAVSSRNIWVARPTPSDSAKEIVLPVDWEAITRRGATDTNYQIMPGDRVFIGEDKVVASANYLKKIVSPLGSMLWFTLLNTSPGRNIQLHQNK